MLSLTEIFILKFRNQNSSLIRLEPSHEIEFSFRPTFSQIDRASKIPFTPFVMFDIVGHVEFRLLFVKAKKGKT